MQRLLRNDVIQAVVLTVLAASVLWKGGKTVDATWILLACAAVTVPAAWAAQGRGADVRRLLWGAGFAFFWWTVLSFVLSGTRNYGLDEVLRDGALLFLLLWAARSCAEPDERSAFVSRFLTVLALSALAACLIGVAVYALQPVNRFVGTFFDLRFQTDYWPNAWGQFLLLAWPAVLWWARRATTRASTLLRVGLLGFTFGCLLLSYSRGALIAFAGQILLLCLLAGVRWWRGEGEEAWRPAPRRQAFAVGLAVVAALVTFVCVNALRGRFHDVQDVGSKVTFTADEGTSSIDERAQFWSQSYALSLQKPWFGWGPYSFRFVQPRLQQDVLATSDHPHNVFLKLAMERGWPAALLFAALAVGIWGAALAGGLKPHGWAMRTVGDREAWDTPILLTAVAGVLAHNLIDYNLQFVGIALPFWLMLGILASPFDAVREPRTLRHSHRRGEAIVMTLLLLVALYEGGMLVASSLGRGAEARGDVPGALQWYHVARRELFSRDLHLSRTQLFLKEDRLPEARAALELSFLHNREDYRAWKLLGELAMRENRVEEALSAYETAFRLARFNDLGILRGLMEAAEKKGSRALVDARKDEIERLVSAFADAIQRNAHFIALSINVEELRAVSARLGALYPERKEWYDGLVAASDAASAEVRNTLQARPPGFLW